MSTSAKLHEVGYYIPTLRYYFEESREVFRQYVAKPISIGQPLTYQIVYDGVTNLHILAPDNSRSTLRVSMTKNEEGEKKQTRNVQIKATYQW